jgi:hypothetical protein
MGRKNKNPELKYKKSTIYLIFKWDHLKINTTPVGSHPQKIQNLFDFQKGSFRINTAHLGSHPTKVQNICLLIN